MAERTTGNMYSNTGFRNNGRIAGYGMEHDDYSEESGNSDYEKYSEVRFPNDGIKPEDLNGPVITYKGSAQNV